MREVEEILGIDPQPLPTTQITTVSSAKNALATVKQNYAAVFENKPDERFNEDFEEIRDSLKTLISEVTDVIQKLSLIAQDSEKASHFAALAQMTTTLLNANKQLLEIYSEKKRYHSSNQKDNNVPEGGISVQNAIFTGSTSDLTKWVKKLQEEGE